MYVALLNIPARRSSEESRDFRITPTETLPPLERRPLFPASPQKASRAARSSSSSTKNERLCDWEGRENESLVFESKIQSCEYTSTTPKSQSERINQAECRMFDLSDGEQSLPTRRLVMRNRENTQDFVSYCKILDILRLLFE